MQGHLNVAAEQAPLANSVHARMMEVGCESGMRIGLSLLS